MDNIKRSIFSWLLVISMLALPSLGLAAINYTFSNFSPVEDELGDAQARIYVTIAGNILTADIYNDSAVDGIDYINAPGITGFGFELNPSIGLTATSWSLTASAFNGSTPNPLDLEDHIITPDWNIEYNFLGTGQPVFDGIRADYMPQASADGSQGIAGALYNPLVLAETGFALGSEPQYFTKATLIMTFGENIQSILEASESDWKAYVRVQNLGPGGEFSEKLWGEDGGTTTTVVPEPASLLLMGTGLLGAGFVARRKIRK